ncbi:phage late control D family protein [Clostridium sporogenes]|uniref:phage late control D family protein n=1 Tax=Clostridium sporogenes TaxID=1509 RepID=UPI0006659DBC|nr:hypothetical protein [Clostridium sporogenes]
MKLFYNDKDITNDVDIIDASIKDNSGGIADTISIEFSDIKKLWRKWEPQKGDEIILSKNNFSSGKMFIDELGVTKGRYFIKAISIPLESKTNNTKSWEKATFIEIAQNLVQELGLQLETYYIKNYLYERVDMINKTNLEFLNYLCILESFNLKICNGKAIIYDEKTLESFKSIKTFNEDDFVSDYSFDTISNGLYGSCLIKHFGEKLIEHKITINNIGPTLQKDIKVTNLAEAERFGIGLLRYSNKNETTGTFPIKLDTSLAAGNTIDIKNLGHFNGKYFISSVKHILTKNKSYLNVRKVLEDY